ncbi:MAG TPA: cation diffusion facilitator family transporter [Gemmatimonadales bacterium]|nr:cation diffusion facilitator family transporter [Gemmatimonadales bacterium]
MDRSSLTRFAWLTIAAAVFTMALKATAYYVTGSVGLLSDALESVVNLIGGVMALAMLTVAARPPDEDHVYGHSKAEYFSAVVEGSLIIVAAGSIALAAGRRLVHPRPLESVGIGLAISVAAALVNLGVALVLLRASKRNESITLEASAHHLLTDVWTSVGVFVGVGLAVLTGWLRLDPIVAFLVAANIVWTGYRILRDSVSGLMDHALPEAEQAALKGVLDKYQVEGIQYHALRTRQAGPRRFCSVHVLVPGDWTVQRGHELLERIEEDLRGLMPNMSVFTHLESLDDPASWDDMGIDRPAARPAADA